MALSEKDLEVQKEYLDTLNTLNCCSKPLIDVLTDVAEENREYARVIVKCIEDQLEKVSIDLKLPILYLIDSIIKKEREPVYKHLFCCRLHLLFVKVYKEGKEDVRTRLYKLRVTWNGVLPPVVLSAVDNEVRKINPTWPSLAVHVNPKFIQPGIVMNPAKTEVTPIKREVLMKRRELLELKKRSEQLERMKLQQKSITSPIDKNDRLSAVVNNVFLDVEKLKNGVHNPLEVQKVRETAIAMKNSLLKSLEQNSKDLFPSTHHSTLSDLIKKLDETVKVLSEMEKKPLKRKVVVDVNAPSAVITASNPQLSKAADTPKLLLSENTSTNSSACTKPTTNGIPVAQTNVPTLGIAPVSASSQLINTAAACRPRDPRLRRNEEQEIKVPVETDVTKEVKVSSASTSINTKNDKQNVPLAELSKSKEFVSEVTKIDPSLDSVGEVRSSDVQSVVQADQEKCEKLELPESQRKTLRSGSEESSERASSRVPKNSSTIPEKNRFNSVVSQEDGTIIRGTSLGSAEKRQTNTKGDVIPAKRDAKPTKIKVKVITDLPNESEEQTSKRIDENLPEHIESSVASVPGEKVPSSMTREEREKKLDSFADALIKAGKQQRQQFIENLSKTHSKMAQKLEKRVKKKMAAVEVAIVEEIAPLTPPPAPRMTSPIIVDELMDVTDSGSNVVSVPQSDVTESVAEANQKPDLSDHLDASIKTTSEVERECVLEPVPMDICDDNEKETDLLLEEERTVSVVLKNDGHFDNSAVQCLQSSSINLSEQLKAVMNAAPEEGVALSQRVDPGTTLSNGANLNLNCHLPIVTDIIVPGIAVSTDNSAAVSSTDPFGLSQTATKDVDYRQLFRFPLPAVIASTVGEGQTINLDDAKSPAPISNESDAAVDVVDSVAAPSDRLTVKRKPGDELFDGVKRRRTISGCSSDAGGSDGEPAAKEAAAAALAASNGDEEPSAELQLITLSSSLERILNVPSDSDDETGNGQEQPDGDAGGARQQSSYSQTAVLNEEEVSSDVYAAAPSAEAPSASKSPPFVFPMLQLQPHFYAAPNFDAYVATTTTTTKLVPEANEDMLRMIRRDPIRRIHIDGISREIRHYGSTAVTFLSWDDPRQISFFNGMRKIIIDNDIEIQCYLNGPDVERKIYGKFHRFRLGAPTRELYIDGIGYECYFDGSSKRIRIDGISRYVRLTGGPPRVHIGQEKRQDLVAGKINIIIDEEHTIPVYLDAKPQAIYVNNTSLILMFVDSLKLVLINDVQFRTDFGGLSQSFKFRNKVYHFRFDILPAGIVPGAVSIFQMFMTKLPAPPPLPPSLQYCDDYPLISAPPSVPSSAHNSVLNRERKPVMVVENVVNGLKSPPQNNLLDTVNIDELFQKLVASGIVPGATTDGETKSADKAQKPVDNSIKHVDFSKPESLKQRQPGLINKLYSGMQCGSCGLRFPQEQTVKYSQHLDWHFRLNRRGKDGARLIHSRKWYYNSSHWMQFQEIEDSSERGTSWFENQAATEYTEEEHEELPSVSAGENAQGAFCELCQDKFEQFYNEDIDEWQLRNAIRVEEKLYHPLCHKDHTEKETASPIDVDEIVDLDEPTPSDHALPTEEDTIILDEVTENENNIGDESSVVSNEVVTINDESVVIKQEKPDACEVGKSNTANGTDLSLSAEILSGKETEADNDSDIEEVQLIEQPIEEIVINDDQNDLDRNLETLNVEDIITAQQEINVLATETEDTGSSDYVDRVVDITSASNEVSIDGNIEFNDSLQAVNTATKIKINIAKVAVSQNEERGSPPKSPQSRQELSTNFVIVEEPPKESSSKINGFLVQPLPPGEEPVSADKKPKLKDRKLTEYPTVANGTELSGLCSIM